MRFYPELHIPSKEFNTKEEAIEAFKKEYGNNLVAVISEDPIECVWESDVPPALR